MPWFFVPIIHIENWLTNLPWFNLVRYFGLDLLKNTFLTYKTIPWNAYDTADLKDILFKVIMYFW